MIDSSFKPKKQYFKQYVVGIVYMGHLLQEWHIFASRWWNPGQKNSQGVSGRVLKLTCFKKYISFVLKLNKRLFPGKLSFTLKYFLRFVNKIWNYCVCTVLCHVKCQQQQTNSVEIRAKTVQRVNQFLPHNYWPLSTLV